MNGAVEEDRGGRPLALAMVVIGAAGFAASLTAVYTAMRDLMINSGGFCASGGPYQINPDQVCETGQIWLVMGGSFGLFVFGAILVGASGRYGGWNLAGVGLLLWAATFGALGWNFLQLGIDPPENMSGAVGWIVCGVVFMLMALGGLIPGVIALASYFKTSADPEAPTSNFDAPLVKAEIPPGIFDRPGGPGTGGGGIDG